MLTKNFRIAAKKHGKYCPAKNELRIRKGRRIYSFTCTDREIKFAASDQPQVVLPISPDATVRELSRGIHSIINSHEKL